MNAHQLWWYVDELGDWGPFDAADRELIGPCPDVSWAWRKLTPAEMAEWSANPDGLEES